MCFHEILESQALTTPTAEAVCSWDGQMSYIELDQVTSRLGNYLAKWWGIQGEMFIGFSFDKSLTAIITMIDHQRS